MIYQSETRDLRIALGGDIMLTRRLAVYQEDAYLRLRELLQGADAVFANFESSAHDYAEATPNLTPGTYMTTEPALLDELKWLGVDIVSCANNHAFDYGEEGILANIKHLDAAGIPHAGTGRNLREAQAPAYVDTLAGRVAVVAATATFHEWNRAGEQRPDVKGRPGVNALGFRTTYHVDDRALGDLRRIAEGVGLEAEHERTKHFGFFSAGEMGGGNTERAYTFLGKHFMADANGRFNASTVPNAHDMEGNLRQIREAKRQADWVLASLHAHETGGETALTATKRSQLEEPADFVKDYARRCIDAGADMFVGHGPHFTLGIEIYHGKPIFYSLGDFILENETVRHFPAHSFERFGLGHDHTPADFLDARSDGDTKAHPGDRVYWESVVAVCVYRGGELKDIELWPIDLGHGRTRPQRGRPVLAGPEVSHSVLDRLERLCQRVGGRLERVDGRARVAPPPTAATTNA